MGSGHTQWLVLYGRANCAPCTTSQMSDAPQGVDAVYMHATATDGTPCPRFMEVVHNCAHMFTGVLRCAPTPYNRPCVYRAPQVKWQSMCHQHQRLLRPCRQQGHPCTWHAEVPTQAARPPTQVRVLPQKGLAVRARVSKAVWSSTRSGSVLQHRGCHVSTQPHRRGGAGGH